MQLNSANEAPPPCPPRALWHELPPSLGSGIPARVRSARPIPPRSLVTDLLPLRPPGFRISLGELRQSAWTAPDQEPTALELAEPAIVAIQPRFPACAAAAPTLPRTPMGAELGMWTATDDSVPSVACCQFANSTQPVLPLVGAVQMPVSALVAPQQASWQLSHTFFTPRRSIQAPEPTMRPLAKPEAAARPVAPAALRPARTAGFVEDQPWKVLENGKPAVPGCSNLAPAPEQQLSEPRPPIALRPKVEFQDPFPPWETVPNSFVRRIEIEFFTEAATLVALSSPLPALAH